MSEALILEFGGIDAAKYREVNSYLGINPDTGEGDWPDGLVTHTGTTGTNGLLVFEVWESQAAQGAFMESRLGPALGKAGMGEPTRAEWLSVDGLYPR